MEGLKDLQDGKGSKDFLVRWASAAVPRPRAYIIYHM